jgi:hypothetical protein
MLRIAYVRASLVLCVVGCETGPDVDPTCDETSIVVLDSAVRTDAESIRIEGMARAESGIAFRTVFVEGVAAVSQGFNFQRFSLVLDDGQLPVRGDARSCAGELTEQQVCLHVLSTTSCGTPSETWEVVTIRGESPPALTVEIPRDVVPADGRSPITILVTSLNGDVDATVTLVAPPGDEGAGSFADEADVSELVLSLDPTATAVVYGRAPGGFLVLEASASRGAAVRELLTVAGPPRITPSELDAPAGSTFSFEVASEATLERCQSFGPAIIRFDGVTEPASEGVALDGPVEGGSIAIPADATGTTTLRCWDEFGQSSEATFDVLVPDP